MNIHDEQDLLGQLDRALGTITPGPAPVGAAVRQGRRIRARRRLSLAAGLAAVVAAGVCAPFLVHRLAGPAPAVTAVTVYPPGPNATAGLIASGTAGGHRWRVLAERPGADGAGPGNQCIVAVDVLGCGPVSRASAATPVQLTSAADGQLKAAYGPVARSVRYVTVGLATGQLLTCIRSRCTASATWRSPPRCTPRSAGSPDTPGSGP